MQASIKGVSGAWLEQRDPLGLMSAVQGTVGCSSSSLQVFIYVIYPCFRQEGSVEAAFNVSLTSRPFGRLGRWSYQSCVSKMDPRQWAAL